MKSKKKPKRVKPRVKVAPPSKRHKSINDYDRRSLKNKTKEALDDVLVKMVEPIEFENHIIHDGDDKEENEKSEQLDEIKELERGLLGRFFEKTLNFFKGKNK